jgi:uncharacterized protein
MRKISLISEKNIFLLFGLSLIFNWFIGDKLLAQIPETPTKPSFQTSVYDEAGILTPEQKNALEQKLIQYADSTSTQIVVATINTTNGEEIGYYAAQWGQKWGIGQKGKDNGVLILVAKDDRKMTIQVGYGLEHLLTDALSRRIIENSMVPHFRENDYYGGLNEATDIIFQIFAGEYKADAVEDTGSIFPILFIFLVFILIIIVIVKASKNSRNNGGGKTSMGDDLFGPIILSRGGRGSWGGGWSTGGGGWSSGGSGGFGGGGFGGGGFGGGGASGGW